LSFFLKEALLGQGLADDVVLVAQANQAVEFFTYCGPYDLVVINLTEAWAQELQLCLWLNQQSQPFTAVVILSPDMSLSAIPNPSFITLYAPLSLHTFTECARQALALPNSDHVVQTGEA
jgi:hypothetical protein